MSKIARSLFRTTDRRFADRLVAAGLEAGRWLAWSGWELLPHAARASMLEDAFDRLTERRAYEARTTGQPTPELYRTRFVDGHGSTGGLDGFAVIEGPAARLGHGPA